MNVPLVDIEQRLATVPDFVEDPIKYLYDGIHVTDAGSVFYAQEIASILTPLIQDMRILASHEE